MKATRTKSGLRSLLVLAAACLLAGSAPQAAAQYNYFPTGAEDDGRTVVLAGDSIETLAQDSLTFLLAVPPGVTQFELGIFDGETGLAAPDGKHWDNGTTQLQYALFYDPFQQGDTSPANLVGLWRGNETNPTAGGAGAWAASSATFPDNGWWSLTVNVPEPPDPLPGQAPSGASYYHLCVSYRATTGAGATDPCTGDLRPVDAAPQTISNFKIRATANISVLSFAFAYEGAMRFTGGNRDPFLIYPAWDGVFPSSGSDFWLTTPTSYDGSWQFEIDVPTSTERLRLFDGDFDFGTWSGFTTGIPSGVAFAACADTNDADTPDDGFFPSFAMEGSVRVDDSLPEGERTAGGTPPDDNPFDPFRRSPCIHWTLTSPDGTVYVDDNPSSQREWEQFLISSEASCDSSPTCDPSLSNCADYCEDALLPPGVWTVEVEGVDLSNLNAWRSDNLNSFCLSCEELPRPYLVGDTVFSDLDGDGVQEPGEQGISGVLVELLDENGVVVDTVLTGDPGSYSPGMWASCQSRNTGGATLDGMGLDDLGLYCFDVSVPNQDPDGVDTYFYTVRIADSNFEPGGALYDFFGTDPNASRPSPTQTNAVVELGDNVLTYDFGYFVQATDAGAGTIGYWKNHVEAWPLDTIVLGGVEYSLEEALALLKAEVNGDMTIQLAQQLIAAKLNVANGTDPSCIAATIAAADAYLAAHPPGSKPKGSVKGAGEDLKDVLDAYNNGRLCAPSRG